MAREVGLAEDGVMPHQGRKYWARLVAELERSGQAHREFAAKHGVKVVTLEKWLYRFRAEKRRSVPLVPVRVAAPSAPLVQRPSPSPSAERIEIELPSGVRLRFCASSDVAYICALVRQLG